MVSKKSCIYILLAFIGILILINVLLNPIPQPQSYHHFADQRSFLGITNAWNVLSNVLLAIGGIWGLVLLATPDKLEFSNQLERIPWIGVAAGLLLTAAGSCFYHLAPDNARLVWDRLPITLILMSFLAIMINERIHMRGGSLLWPFLVCIGIYSVLQWQASELQGRGDLRLYASLQVYTFFAITVMMLTPPLYTRSWDIPGIILLYILAKLCELFDKQIYVITHEFISGHTLKHIAVGIAGIWLIYMVKMRKRIDAKTT